MSKPPHTTTATDPVAYWQRAFNSGAFYQNALALLTDTFGHQQVDEGINEYIPPIAFMIRRWTPTERSEVMVDGHTDTASKQHRTRQLTLTATGRRSTTTRPENTPPVDLTRTASLFERSVTLEPCLNPVLVAALHVYERAIKFGGSRSLTTVRSFQLDPNARKHPAAHNTTFGNALDIRYLHVRSTDAILQPRGQLPARLSRNAWGPFKSTRDTAESCRLGFLQLRRATTGSTVYLKAVSEPGDAIDAGGPLDLWHGGARRPAVGMTPMEALELVGRLEHDGAPVLDPDHITDQLKALCADRMMLMAEPGFPGLVAVFETSVEETTSRLTTSAEHAAVLRDRFTGQALSEPRVEDTLRMAKAKPHADPVLYEPQQRVVGTHLQTEWGFLNASQTGTGKTVMTVRGMRARAQRLPGYRAIVVCGKPLRSQWASEIARADIGFPEATVLRLPDRNVAQALRDFDRSLGNDPGIILVSYEQARLRNDALCAHTYDEIVVDEAAKLGNKNSQLSRALLKLRKRAKVAIGLTATPVNLGTRDLDRIVGFIRDDHEMLSAQRIGKAYGRGDEISMLRLRRALGPTMLRVSKEELRDHMPTVRPAKHVFLDCTPAEARLQDVLLSEVYNKFQLMNEQLKRVMEISPEDPELTELQRALRSSRAFTMGAARLALLAAIDPEAVRSSDAKAAAIAEMDGVLDAAIKDGSTLRQIVADTIANAGEPTLVFCESLPAMKLLARELENEHQITAGLLVGGLSEPQVQDVKHRFMTEQTDVVLVGGKGNSEGHNLQRATLIIHYDLPTRPARFEQRTGRSERLGSTADGIDVLLPVMRATMHERVAKLLIPRSVLAFQALDHTPGHNAEENTIAKQLGGLAQALGERDESSVLMQVCAQIFAERSGHSPAPNLRQETL